MPSVQLPAAFPSLLPWEGVPCPAQLSAALRPHPAPCWLGLLPLPFLRTLEDRHPAAGHDRRARSPASHPEGPKDKQQNPGIARNLQTERACVSLYMARDLQCRRFVYVHVRMGALPQLATTALVYYKQNKLLFRAGSFLLWNQSPFQKMAQCTLESLPV